MSETGQAEKERRYARIGALTDAQRRELLFRLCENVPEPVDTALDVVEGRPAPEEAE